MARPKALVVIKSDQEKKNPRVRNLRRCGTTGNRYASATDTTGGSKGTVRFFER